jgi:cytoskeleton protein RodZ
VKVTDKSGNVVLSKTGEAGDESAVDGKAPFDLVIGNASGVKLYYKGNPVELKPSTNASSGVARLTLE